MEPNKLYIELLPEDEEEEIHDIRRRGSNVSLSRYRSCPQLLDELDPKKSQIQSFEATVDDSAGIKAKLSPQSPVPLIRRQFQFDLNQNGMPGSATPTPPSTPGSHRSLHSQRDSPSTPVQGLSPVSTPRLRHRARMSRTSLSRGSSGDSTYDSKSGVLSDQRNSQSHVPFNEENLKKHEQLSGTVTTTVSTLRAGQGEGASGAAAKGGRRKLSISQQQHYLGPSVVSGDPSTGSSQDKCEKWLQSLHLSKPDKIKSRSHIQLPPV